MSEDTEPVVVLYRGQSFLFTLLCLWIISLVFRQESLMIRPDRILFCILAVTSAYFCWSGRLVPIRIGWLEFCFGAFSILCVASLVSFGGNRTEGLGRNTELNEVLNMTLYPFGAYLLARHLPYSRQQTLWLTSLLVILGAYLAVTAICERFGINSLIWPRYIIDPSFGTHLGRARGPFVQAVFMGFSLSVCLLGIVLALSQAQTWIRRGLLMMLIPLCLAGVYFTNTRGPWVALGLALCTGIALRSSVRRLFIGIIVFILVGFCFSDASKFSLSRGNLFTQRQNTIEQRELNYRIAFHMGLDHPLTGVGWSRMGYEFDRYFSKYYRGEDWVAWDGNHNEYLGLFAEVGFFALFFFLALELTIAKRLITAIRELPEFMEFERSTAVCALASLIGLAFISYCNQVRAGPFHIVIVFLLCGLTAGAMESARAIQQDVTSDEGSQFE